MPHSQSLLDGKYQIVRRLGEGGMGSVFEGKHLGTGRRVALKVVPPEILAKGPDVGERFRREAMVTGSIDTQHIAHVLDTGVCGATKSPYIVMELLHGEDLQQALRHHRRFREDLALRVAAQACLGLQQAHDAGVVHRDVKPANLFLTRRDGAIVVKLLDFGIAKARVDPLESASSDMTATGAMLGSPLYMSPEQARGRRTIDHRADLFSLGVVLYEMLTGKAPHAEAATVGDLLVRICGEPARPVREKAPHVGAATAAIVHKALAIEAADRFASAREMLDAIRALLPGGIALDGTAIAPPPRPSEHDVSADEPRASRPSFFPESPSASFAAATALSTPVSGSKPVDRASTPPRPTGPPPPLAILSMREAMERRIFVPAAKKAAVLLWGDDGLNAIASAVEHDTREEFFRPVQSGQGEWVPARQVIDWCYAVLEGPARHDIGKMREYIDRTFDFSFGVVRRAVLRLADPAALVPKLPGFWRHDHVGGEMEAALEPGGNGCTLRLTDSPFTQKPATRAGMAENYRYAFSLTRARDVTESNALERQRHSGQSVLVIRLRWR